MKKLLSLLTAIALMLTLAGCGEKTPVQEVQEKTTEIKGYGYGGEMVLNLTTKGEDIVNLEVVSNHETAEVFNRAFPVLKERILNADSPIVDNVSGATFSSFAIKKAVADQMKVEGKDFGEVNMTTEPVHEKKQLEDATCDLVIVGGGAAGLTAAVSAREAGVENVILVEKMDILSGSAKFDRNFFDHFNTPVLKEAGHDLTKEQFIEKKAGSNGLEMATKYAEVAYGLDEWFRAHDITLDFHFGSKQSHMAPNHAYAGDHIQTALENAVNKLGVDVRMATKGTDLVETDGTVTGVKVETRDGYYQINAKAVIVATGGYGMNKDLIKKYKPEYIDFMSSNQCSSTGDFIPVFENHNVKIEDMEEVGYNYILYPTRHLTGGASAKLRVSKDGNEFNEMTNEVHYYITDAKGIAEDKSHRMEKQANLGYYTEFASLEDLAKEFGIDYANLLETIKVYNEKQTAKGKRNIELEGKWYGSPMVLGIHTTQGGAVINPNAQVLNNNDEVINGLYAAGDCTRKPGNYHQSVVFGKVAGEEAAKFILNK